MGLEKNSENKAVDSPVDRGERPTDSGALVEQVVAALSLPGITPVRDVKKLFLEARRYMATRTVPTSMPYACATFPGANTIQSGSPQAVDRKRIFPCEEVAGRVGT